MTPAQETTVNQITAIIEKLQGKVKVGVSNFSGTKHIFLYITQNRVNYGVCETLSIFCDVQINSKGNIVKGKWNRFDAIKTKKTYYIP